LRLVHPLKGPKSQFQELFHEYNGHYGVFKTPPEDLAVIDDISVAEAPFKVSPDKRSALDAILQEYLQCDIRESEVRVDRFLCPDQNSYFHRGDCFISSRLCERGIRRDPFEKGSATDRELNPGPLSGVSKAKKNLVAPWSTGLPGFVERLWVDLWYI